MASAWHRFLELTSARTVHSGSAQARSDAIRHAAVSDRRKPGAVLPIMVTLAVLLGIYIGMYYRMVIEGVNTDGPTAGQSVPFYGFYREAHWLGRSPTLHEPDSAIAGFFYPVHWFDRHFRADAWKPRW